jgi:DNA mismatch endonuclease (patch repair protein)
MDKLSPEQRHVKAAIKQEQSDASISSAEREQARRSANMAAIRSKDTKPEMIVRRGLWKRGFRYRLNHKRLPGHPDLVLRKYRTCIFVNGCFWHGHKDCKYYTVPKTNTEFWVAKVARNKERDQEVWRKLEAKGWYVIIVWECQLKKGKLEETVERVAAEIVNNGEAYRTEQQERRKTREEYQQEQRARKERELAMMEEVRHDATGV